MKKDWRTIDKMALEAASFLLNYCDIHEHCPGCIFYDENGKGECAAHICLLSLGEMFIEEMKRNV